MASRYEAALMPGWLLLISRDTELTRALGRALVRTRGGCQLWAVGSSEQARRSIARRDTLPAIIVIDELFLENGALEDVAEEFSWYAPLIAIGQAGRQPRMAPLVAEGKLDFLSRDDHFIPLAAAMVERAVRCEQEVDEQIRQAAANPRAGKPTEPSLDPEGFPAAALRLLGAILDNLDTVLADRAHLPTAAARRLGRAADLAFDLKTGLRLLAGHPEPEAESAEFPSP
jgi:plasmid stabilization system protein ParE